MDTAPERPPGAPQRLTARLAAPLTIAAGAVVLWVLSGVGFANYDTLYALTWGGQLARGETPQYGIPIAPTPHPLIEALGVVLSPLSPSAVEGVTVALGFLALSACGWVVYRLGSAWFGRAAGALAALILLTRVPVLSYGVRAYVDIPYLLLVLCAVLVDRSQIGQRRHRSGAPVLVLLALAGLLRPEAWVFSGLYWLYLAFGVRQDSAREPAGISGASERSGQAGDGWTEQRSRLMRLALLAVAAPLVWILSDLAITGHPLWSLTNTRHTATTLDRITGIRNVPEYIPRRIGEILGPAVLLGAALGGVLSLWLLPRRALAETGTDLGDTRFARIPESASAKGACHPASVKGERHPASVGAVVGVAAVVVFAAFATVGLPINTRYAFLAAAILCIFCGAGVFGWTRLPREDPRRRWWMAGSALVLLALLVSIPSQYHTAHRELRKLARQESIQNELLALVKDGSITRGCEPVGVPNHAPIPLLALYLETSPRQIVSAEISPITHGAYVDPASKEVEEDYVLDPHDPHLAVNVPPGFSETHANRSWFIFSRCP
jgi:hypothetical protein